MNRRFALTASHAVHRWRLRPMVLSLACMGFGAALAQTLPTGPAIQGGTFGAGNFAVSNLANGGQHMQINQSSLRGIINWQTFSIGALDHVNIAQAMGARSVLLNRVVGSGGTLERSVIDGTLSANGRVFVINPAGVLFGGGAQVNVGGLVASSLDLAGPDADQKFMSGGENFTFAYVDGALQGDVVNEGRITASGLNGQGGTVAMVAPYVVNNGTISAPGGTVALGAGERVVLDVGGDGLTKLSIPVRRSTLTGSEVRNDGTIEAPGGRIHLATNGSDTSKDTGITVVGGVLVADSMVSRNGEIVLDSGASRGGVTLTGATLSAQGKEPGLKGGSISATGQMVQIALMLGEGVLSPSSINASGSAGGGSVRLEAKAEEGVARSGVLTLQPETVVRADATEQGNGGQIHVLGDRSLRAHGTLSVRGGASGGDGGFVETSGGHAVPDADQDNAALRGGFDLSGVTVDAGAPRGQAGKWLIDPYDVTIVNGSGGPGAPVLTPLDPVTDTVLQDGDINNALNLGANVTITTGTGGSPFAGDIFMDDAQIHYTGAAERTLTLQAHRSVRANSGTSIASADAGGPLNVVFTADANGGGAATGGGQVSFDGQIYSNGGNVTMTGAWANNSNAGTSVHLGPGAVVDTRRGNTTLSEIGYSGGSDAQAGGNVQLTGRSVAPKVQEEDAGAAVLLENARIATSTGNVDIFGSSTLGSGVQVTAAVAGTGIHTTSGNVGITGVGSHAPETAVAPGHGVVIMGDENGRSLQPTVQTGSGTIDINGLRLSEEAQTGGDGVLIGPAGLITSTGGGDIRITGESQSTGGAGVRFAAEQANPTAATYPGARVTGSGNVVLRASNTGDSDALVFGEGSGATAVNVLNLRPGGVDLAGDAQAYVATPVDRATQAIFLGGAETNGFSVSAADLGRLAAPTLVAGSSTHAGDIIVQGAVNRGTGNLTLQNTGVDGDGAGSILLEAPVTAGQVGLLARGNVTQTADAPVVAQTLLAHAELGSVLLDQAPNNVAAATLGGDAGQAFRYQDVDALRVGSVSVTGFDSAANAPQAVSSGALAAQTVFVRTLSGDLLLATDVSSSNGADLVAASRFQNQGTFAIAGAPWRVWADTWVGETRGGMAGSGPLPNLFNCAYLGPCGVSVTPGDNHFIYRQQPVATVFIDNASRDAGAANPAFTYTLSGLILGDTTGGITGSTATSAGSASPAGAYPITGTFASAAGYAVDVRPGTLTVNEVPPPPPPPPPVVEFRLPDFTSVDWVREETNTYTFDRNIGPAPICFATGPLQGDRAEQGDDQLAREWSRVRSRPNLLSCVDTERKNGCGDF